jgi:hypothetical protein
MPHKLTFNEVIKLKYYKNLNIVEILTVARDPIVYTLKDGVFRENKFAFNSKKKAYSPNWSSLNSKIKYEIYDDADIKSFLHKIDSGNLWNKKSGNILEYEMKNLLPNSTRKKSVYNKNGRLLPKGWHRVSKNGKNSFEGPKGEVYNTMTHFANKNNSRVRPQTYKRREGNDTWYVLPDGSISWYPQS